MTCVAYATPMMKYYGLKDSLISDLMMHACGIFLLTSCAALVYVARTQSDAVLYRFTVGQMMGAFSRLTVMSCHGAKARAGGLQVTEELSLGWKVGLITFFVLAESQRTVTRIITSQRHVIKDSTTVKQKIIAASLLMELYYVVTLHFGDATIQSWFAPKLKATDFISIHWACTIGFLRFITTLQMFTLLPEEKLGTVAKFHAVDNLLQLYMMRKHQAVFNPAAFEKHFTLGVARLGATLFAAMR